MTMFNPATFRTAPEPKLFHNGFRFNVGEYNPRHELAKRLGSIWRKTPFEGVLYVGMDGLQVTLSRYGYNIFIYRYPTVTEFRKDFKEGKHLEDGNFVEMKLGEFDPGFGAVCDYIELYGDTSYEELLN